MTDEEIERAIDLGDYQSGYVAAMQLLVEVRRLRHYSDEARQLRAEVKRLRYRVERLEACAKSAVRRGDIAPLAQALRDGES